MTLAKISLSCILKKIIRKHTALSMNKTLKKEKKHFKECVKILSYLLKLAKLMKAEKQMR